MTKNKKWRKLFANLHKSNRKPERLQFDVHSTVRIIQVKSDLS